MVQWLRASLIVITIENGSNEIADKLKWHMKSLHATFVELLTRDKYAVKQRQMGHSFRQYKALV